MAKEIHEQPEVVGHTLARYIDWRRSSSSLSPGLSTPRSSSACRSSAAAPPILLGSSPNIGSSAGRLPVEIDVASEYRYREAPVDDGGLTIVVSQSGETADTLASLRYVKEGGEDRRRRQRAGLQHRAIDRCGSAHARRPIQTISASVASDCQIIRRASPYSGRAALKQNRQHDCTASRGLAADAAESTGVRYDRRCRQLPDTQSLRCPPPHRIFNEVRSRSARNFAPRTSQKPLDV
jgi:hypothetical protein